MSRFCSVINFAVESRQRISTETLLEAMASVMYRLLHMNFELNSRDEAIRLGLLAFSSHVFLQWTHLGVSYSHLKSIFRACLLRLSCSHICPQLRLWLLMAGVVSIFDAADDEWITPLLLVNIDLCKMESWGQIRQLLKSFLWVDLLHDKPSGRIAYKLLH